MSACRHSGGRAGVGHAISRAMRILVLPPWFPWPAFDGGRIRVFETIRYLAERHEVSLAAPVAAPEMAQQAAPLRALCEQIEAPTETIAPLAMLAGLANGLPGWRPIAQCAVYQPKLASAIRRLTSRQRFDIVQIEFSFAAAYLSAIDPGSAAKTVLTMHNVETARFERELRFPQPWLRRIAMRSDQLLARDWEKAAVERFNGVAVVSEPDLAWVRRHVPRAVVELAPNGIDTARYAPLACAGPAQAGPCAAFTGVMNYPPNVDAAVWFCEQILPTVRARLPEFVFRIVGRDPTPQVRALARHPGVVVTGQVPDIAPHLADCLALLVPLRSGGGTRLKILEAMALGRPVVSTPLGAEGLEVVDGETILLAETAGQFADQLAALVKSPELRDRLARQGRALVEARYDWRQCLAGLDRLYDRLLNGAAA
jgi:sugar transferase (PEP-CTERM/EpsH1 system associated)